MVEGTEDEGVIGVGYAGNGKIMLKNIKKKMCGCGC